LIDALQGPAAVLSANDHYSSLDVGLKLNPVTAYLSLNQEVEMAEIINIIGKTVLKFEKNASTYDISSLPKGIYFVRISKNNRNQVLKFVKK